MMREIIDVKEVLLIVALALALGLAARSHHSNNVDNIGQD